VTSRSARFLAPRSPAEHALRRAVVSLAARYPFARALVNTGRMSVANDYPPAPQLPEGGRSVQNLPLRWADGSDTTLMQLLAEGTQCIGLWLAPTRAEADAAMEATALLPLRLLAIGGNSGLPTLQADDRLTNHLGLRDTGSFVLVRPDAYHAATLPRATPAVIVAALRTALARNTTP
jgi:3-(3-hydroxy-phenyl)propionate hydroxylase